jgi:hypothetical protein
MTVNVPIWKDALGREWTCIITVAQIRLSKELAGVDLLNVFDGELLMSLAEDPVKLSATLWAINKTQADSKQVTQQSFEEGLVGDAIEAAGTALIDGLINFFPSSRRDVLRRAWDKTQMARSDVMTMAGHKLDSEEMSGAIARLLENASQEVDQQLNALGRSSTNLPES